MKPSRTHVKAFLSAWTVVIAVVLLTVAIFLAVQNSNDRSVDAKSAAAQNRVVIIRVCNDNLKQDQRLAVLVRASRRNPGHPPSTLRAFDFFLRATERARCPER